MRVDALCNSQLYPKAKYLQAVKPDSPDSPEFSFSRKPSSCDVRHIHTSTNMWIGGGIWLRNTFVIYKQWLSEIQRRWKILEIHNHRDSAPHTSGLKPRWSWIGAMWSWTKTDSAGRAKSRPQLFDERKPGTVHHFHCTKLSEKSCGASDKMGDCFLFVFVFCFCKLLRKRFKSWLG